MNLARVGLAPMRLRLLLLRVSSGRAVFKADRSPAASDTAVLFE